MQYLEALEKLDRAFDKLVIKKDVESSAEKKHVAREFLDWKTEIATKSNSLKTKYPLAELEKLNAGAMADRRDAIYVQRNVA